jgi:hypothetical protein
VPFSYCTADVGASVEVVPVFVYCPFFCRRVVAICFAAAG